MLQLMIHLAAQLRGAPEGTFDGAPKDTLSDLHVVLDFHLWLHLLTLVDGSSENTPTFEVEIKGALEVTTELHLKILMLVYLLEQKSSQNNSIT